MQHSSVLVKSNPYGLTIYLDAGLPFEQILADTRDHFRRTARFFKNARIALVFRGRTLTPEEEHDLVDAVTEEAGIRVICVIDESEEHAKESREVIEQAMSRDIVHNAKVYMGTLSHGMRFETDRTALILGDVDPGAVVVAAGNVLVMGCCMGSITAGANGNRECFAAALTLLPSHLRIADRTAVTAITKRTNTGEYPVNPRIAYFREDHLAFLPLGAAAFGMLYGEGDREDSE